MEIIARWGSDNNGLTTITNGAESVPIYQILLLLFVVFVFGWLTGAWVARNRLIAEQNQLPAPAASLPLGDVEKYVAGIERFATQVTPIWAIHIETSRQQMDQAIADLTKRFAGITASLDAALKAQGVTLSNSNDDVFTTSNVHLQKVVSSLDEALQENMLVPWPALSMN
jgi:methyl-accepting chemotaxis protein